jgi:hypothetical protein
MVHCFEQAFADVVHPASEKAPNPTQESPAPQSESELQTVPASLSGVVPHAPSEINGARILKNLRTIRIARHRCTGLRS